MACAVMNRRGDLTGPDGDRSRWVPKGLTLRLGVVMGQTERSEVQGARPGSLPLADPKGQPRD